MEASGVTRKELAPLVELYYASHTQILLFYFHVQGHQDLPSQPTPTFPTSCSLKCRPTFLFSSLRFPFFCQKLQHVFNASQSPYPAEDLYLPTAALTASETRRRKTTRAKSLSSRLLTHWLAPLGGCKYWMKAALKVKMCSFHWWMLRGLKETLQMWCEQVKPAA